MQREPRYETAVCGCISINNAVMPASEGVKQEVGEDEAGEQCKGRAMGDFVCQV